MSPTISDNYFSRDPEKLVKSREYLARRLDEGLDTYSYTNNHEKLRRFLIEGFGYSSEAVDGFTEVKLKLIAMYFDSVGGFSGFVRKPLYSFSATLAAAAFINVAHDKNELKGSRKLQVYSGWISQLYKKHMTEDSPEMKAFEKLYEKSKFSEIEKIVVENIKDTSEKEKENIKKTLKSFIDASISKANSAKKVEHDVTAAGSDQCDCTTVTSQIDCSLSRKKLVTLRKLKLKEDPSFVSVASSSSSSSRSSSGGSSSYSRVSSASVNLIDFDNDRCPRPTDLQRTPTQTTPKPCSQEVTHVVTPFPTAEMIRRSINEKDPQHPSELSPKISKRADVKSTPIRTDSPQLSERNFDVHVHETPESTQQQFDELHDRSLHVLPQTPDRYSQASRCSMAMRKISFADVLRESIASPKESDGLQPDSGDNANIEKEDAENVNEPSEKMSAPGVPDSQPVSQESEEQDQSVIEIVDDEDDEEVPKKASTQCDDSSKPFRFVKIDGKLDKKVSKGHRHSVDVYMSTSERLLFIREAEYVLPLKLNPTPLPIADEDQEEQNAASDAPPENQSKEREAIQFDQCRRSLHVLPHSPAAAAAATRRCSSSMFDMLQQQAADTSEKSLRRRSSLNLVVKDASSDMVCSRSGFGDSKLQERLNSTKHWKFDCTSLGYGKYATFDFKTGDKGQYSWTYYLVKIIDKVELHLLLEDSSSTGEIATTCRFLSHNSNTQQNNSCQEEEFFFQIGDAHKILEQSLESSELFEIACELSTKVVVNKDK